MALLIGILIVYISITATAAAQTTCQPDSSSKGTHFMVGIPGAHQNPTYVTLFLTTDDDTNARVTAPFIIFDERYIFSKHMTVKLGVTIAHINNDTEFKGIEIEADKPISVLVFTGSANFLEGYLALPVTPISTEFVVASYDAYNYRNYDFSTLMIVGVYSDTFVDLYLPASYSKLPQFSGHSRFELQPFKSFQFQGLTDLTGAIIRSTKPVSVITGSSCSKIPVNVGDCQTLMEQMVPMQYWALEYLIPPIYPQSQYLLRIFARESNTEIAIYNGTSHEKRFLDAFQYMELIIEGTPAFVFADKPINVVQYGYGGNPFMVNGQAVSQQLSRYEFVPQSFYPQNTLAISIKTADLAGLRLNGKKESINAATKMSIMTPVENYTTIFLTVTEGNFHVVDQEQNQRFGAVLYGIPSGNVAFGLPLQLLLKDSECKQNATGNGGTEHTGAPSQCFNCEDMTSLKYCDKVTTCSSGNQVCYVQRYQKSQSVVRYKSGCIDAQNCNATMPGDCRSCCEGDFCNSNGCGDDGLLSIQNRGHLCFDCAHHGEKEVCDTVQLCSSGELCKVERYRWGDFDTHYVQGCADARTCSSKRRSSSMLAARSLPVCSTCCSQDFCNKNCTAPPNIIG